MRIHRITVRNFRGMDDRTVDFATSGVTVIEGENEVGKSSIVDALFFLLEFQDTSQAERVRSARPVPSGRNPEVAAEITAGDYRFVYEKCYGSKASGGFTRLTISEPRREQLSGTEAHDRVTGILSKCVDEALWKALRLQQGVAIEQEQLLTGSSLGAALDAAAGGAKGGDRENNLFARVTEAYEEFYTAKTGKEKSSVLSPSAAADTATQALAELTQQMQALERDSEQCESLAVEFAALRPKKEDQRGQVNELEAKWKEIESEQQREEALHLKLELAEKSLQTAEQVLNSRREKVGAVERARKEVAALEEEHARAAPAAEAHAAALAEASDRLKLAREILVAAQTAQTVRANDESHLRDELDLELLRERLDQVTDAQSAANEAEMFLDSTPIDQKAVEQIEAAHIEVVQAAARLESGSPSVRVMARASFVLGIAGEPRELVRGEQFDLTVLEPVTLRIADMAEVTVAGSKNAADLQEQLEVAARRLKQLCLAASANDLSDAQSLLRRREQEEARLVNAKKTMVQRLRDLSPESLSEKLARTQTKVAEYPAARGSDLPLPGDLTEAKRFHEEANLALKNAKADDVEGLSAHSKLQQSANALEKDDVTRTVKLEGASDALLEAQRELAAGRAKQPDETLGSEVAKGQAFVLVEARAYQEASTKLSAADPEAAYALLKNANAALTRLQQTSHDLEIELAGLRQTLLLRGEEGLADRRDSAQAASMQLRREADSVRRRADAARLLFVALSRRRDDSRKAYIKPFRDNIEALGRVVFGASFSVELRENLQVEKRTLNGVTLDFKDLSTGAKEQLGVLARLACASIVSADGGVPLILDDALGSSDPRRLQRVGAAFNVAAANCQVIVLTCQPDRYRHIGSAKVVRLT